MKKIFLFLLLALSLNVAWGQFYGAVNILTTDGEEILTPICDIEFVYETLTGTEIVTISGERYLTNLSYNTVENLLCESIREFTLQGGPPNLKEGYSLCNVLKVYKEPNGDAEVITYTGERLDAVDPYDTLVNVLMCAVGGGPGGDIYLAGMNIVGTDLILTLNNSTQLIEDISSLLDDTNLPRIVSGNVAGSILTLTRDDLSTIDITLPPGGGGGDDDQFVDLFSISGDTLCISLENDAQDPVCIVLDSIDTDEQGLDSLYFDGTNICISLERNDSTYCVAIDSVNTDDQTIAALDFDCLTSTLSIDIEGDTFPAYNVDLSCLVNDNDNQKVDSFYLDGTDLCISLEDDAEIPVCVDLGILDTDDQQIDLFQYVGGILSISIEDDGVPPLTVDLNPISPPPPDGDDQTIDVFNFDCNTNLLSISLEDDGQPDYVVDLSCISAAGYNWSLSDGSTSTQIDSGDVATIYGTNKIKTTVQTTDSLEVEIDTAGATDGQQLTYDQTSGVVIWADPGGTDDQDLTASVDCGTGVLTIELEDNPSGTQLVDLSCIAAIDSQKVDLFTFDCNTNTLSLSIENDDEAPHTVDLSCLITTNFTITDETTYETVGADDTVTFLGINLLFADIIATDSIQYGIDPTGANPSEVVTWNGTNVVWDSITGDGLGLRYI